MAKLDEIALYLYLGDEEHVLEWIPGKGGFTTKKCNKLLCFSPSRIMHKWHLIWKSKIPPKIAIFLWKIQWGILSTNSFLQNRSGGTIFNAVCP